MKKSKKILQFKNTVLRFSYRRTILIDKKFIAKFLIVAILSRNSVFDRIPAFFIK